MRILPAVVAFCVVLAGCSRTGETAEVGARHPWTVPHVLRIGDFAQPDTLNPYLSQMDVSYSVSSLVYSYLVVADDGGKLIGDLATEVPSTGNGGISSDGLTYTYHLRAGVRWHDGVAFTSADVAASWRAVVDPTHQTLYRNGYDRIASIDTRDAHTVIVHLRNRYPPFVSQFFAPLQEGGKPILAAHVLLATRDFNHGAIARAAVGTGPFKFVSWRRDQGISLVRNDDYFRGKPQLDRVEYHFLPDPQTMLTELQLHRIDLIATPPSGLYNVIQKLSDQYLSLGPWNALALMAVNQRVAGLGDRTVRLAMSLAIDRQQMMATAAHGAAASLRDVVAPTAVGYIVRPPLAHDPKAANSLLDRSGWMRGSDGIRRKNGVALDFSITTIAGSPTFSTLGAEIQSSFKAVGIGLTIKPYPYSGLFSPSGPLLSGRYELAIFGSAFSWDPDTHVYYGCDQVYPHGQNIFGYCNPEYDALEARGLQSEDPSIRAPVYARADAILWNDVAYLPFYQLRRIIVHNPDLKNYRPNATSAPFWNAWEWDI